MHTKYEVFITDDSKDTCVYSFFSKKSVSGILKPILFSELNNINYSKKENLLLVATLK